jgi:cytochrome c-type biogenesis protein CcmH
MRGILFLILLLPTLAFSAIESREFDNPQYEARYFDLIAKLRCLVCQNQNLADSNADLARDLRDRTYNMLHDGKSDKEITDFMVERYGQFVLYEPPFNMHTLLLWLAPVLLSAVGVAVFFNLVRGRRRRQLPSVDAADLEKARSLLKPRNDS